MQTQPVDSIALSSCVSEMPPKRSILMDYLLNSTTNVTSVLSQSGDSKTPNRCMRSKMKLRSSKKAYSTVPNVFIPPAKKLKIIGNCDSTVSPAPQKVNRVHKRWFPNHQLKIIPNQQLKIAQGDFHSSSIDFSNSLQTITDCNVENELLVSKNISQILDESRPDSIDVGLNSTSQEKVQNNYSMQPDSCLYIGNQDKFADDVIDIKYESLDDELNKVESDVGLELYNDLPCNGKSCSFLHASCSFQIAPVNNSTSTTR